MKPCETVHEWIQDRLDGPIPAERAAELDAHLRGCAACREVESGLRRVQAELRSLPEVPLPDRILEAVWARTTEERRERPTPKSARSWWFAAAAAVLIAAALLWLGRPKPTGPSAAQFAQAETDARLALSVAARALHTTERTAVRRVLADEVSPILRRIPVHWPQPAETDPRRSRT